MCFFPYDCNGTTSERLWFLISNLSFTLANKTLPLSVFITTAGTPPPPDGGTVPGFTVLSLIATITVGIIIIIGKKK